jgi:hypothetical protein
MRKGLAAFIVGALVGYLECAALIALGIAFPIALIACGLSGWFIGRAMR